MQMYSPGNSLLTDKPLTVSEITKLIKDTLEGAFPPVSIEGEISNFRPSGAGHWYFSLKDAQAVIQGVMFRNKAAATGFTPKDGKKVIVTGMLSVYDKRGVYQIVCDSMEEAGEGALLAMLEKRKKALAGEGPKRRSPKEQRPLLGNQ